MKLCGIVAEFNPLTNGHEYIISEAKKQTGLPVAIIMSGSIVQRGELPIQSKYERAAAAIKAGASIVLELPVIYSLSSAENFARGAIKYLAALGVSHLAFGVENIDPSLIVSFAKQRLCEPQSIKNAIRRGIKNGESFSKAIFNAYTSVLGIGKDYKKIFSSANNILAAEYLKAIYSMNLDIKPVFVKRTDNGYSSLKPTTSNGKNFASASCVRELLLCGKTSQAKALVPSYCQDALRAIKPEKENERLSAIIISKLREFSSEQLQGFYDIDAPLAGTLVSSAKTSATLQELATTAESKCHRESRIKKDAFLPYFNITKEKFNFLDSKLFALNALAVSNAYKKDLALLKRQSQFPLIVSQKDKEAAQHSLGEIAALNQQASDLFFVAKSLPAQKDKTIFV